VGIGARWLPRMRFADITCARPEANLTKWGVVLAERLHNARAHISGANHGENFNESRYADYHSA
jgi:hypothetical protein